MEQRTNEAAAQGAGGARLKKSDKKPLAVVGIAVAVLLAAYLGLCAWATYGKAVWKGTEVLGQQIGGLTVEEAAARVESALPRLEIGLYLYDGTLEYAPEHSGAPDMTIPLSELGADIDASALVRGAVSFLKSGPFLTAGWRYLTNSGVSYGGGPGDIPVDTARAAATAEAAAERLSIARQDTSFEVSGSAVLVRLAKDGRAVDAGRIQEGLEKGWWDLDLTMNVPYAVDTGKTLTAREIHDQVSAEVKNAGYDAETDAIIPEQVGADFDVAAAQAAMDAAAPGETVSIDAVIEYPEVTADELKEVLFRDVLGEARTKVGGTAARRNNVKLSASSVNGYVMNTGDVFSYNGVVGQRTAARGYQPAPAYVQGETVDEIGGGICQTSSTLYLACLLANLEITERYAHRYIPTYIAAGMDATVSWGGPDYKFTNNTSYPIRIVTKYENSYLTVQVLGTKTDDVTVKMTNEKLSTTNFEVVYEDDPTLAPGTETVKTTPYTGSKWKTYRNLYDGDGKLISSTYEDTSNYKARNKVVLRGPVQTAEPAAPVTGPADLPVTPEEPDIPVETPDAEPPVEEPPETSIIVLPDGFSDGV
nr:VanW family protein [uncultured Oscillibacter sp.]